MAEGSGLGKMGEWKLLQCLGEGLQGKVFLAKNVKTNETRALKYLFKSKMEEKQFQNLKREVAAMDSVKGSKHVVRMLDIDWKAQLPAEASEDGKAWDAVCIFLEVCGDGELFNYLMFTGFFDERLARTYFKMLVEGMCDLHSKGFSHRDIKAENLLLKDGILKIADFGFSAKHELSPGKLTKLRTQCGTPGYMAPELFNSAEYDGPPVDVWAAGVLLFVMLVGSPPMAQAAPADWWFDRLLANQHELFWRAHEQTGHVLSDSAKDLILKLLTPSSKKRLTLAEVKEHAWFKGDACTEKEAIGALCDRKQIVEEKREEDRKEKETERRRKRRQADGSSAFDPFQRSVVLRDLPGSQTKTIQLPSLPASTRLPVTNFIPPCGTSAKETWVNVMKTMDGIFTSGEFKPVNVSSAATSTLFSKSWQATSNIGASFEFRVNMNDVRKQTVVSASRQWGDLLAFNRMFMLLSSGMGTSTSTTKHVILLPPPSDLLAKTKATTPPAPPSSS